MSTLHNAITLALQAHDGQMYGDVPYSQHLSNVASVLMEYGILNEEVLAAAWLHDALEDTALTREEVAASCGERVAELVWRVTDEPGKNRKERKAATLPKIAADPQAVLIKLADRIANVAASIGNNSNLLTMYRREYADFRLALYDASPSARPMWDWLDRELGGER